MPEDHMTSIDVVREFYRTFREKDYDAFAALCTPDLEWIQCAGFPGGATRRGPREVVEGVFKSFGKDWEAWRFQAEEFLPAGDGGVAVVGFYEGVHRVTRKPFRAATVHLFDLAGGKIRRFRQFADTQVIHAAMRD
jgi:uncharacterized protein